MEDWVNVELPGEPDCEPAVARAGVTARVIWAVRVATRPFLMVIAVNTSTVFPVVREIFTGRAIPEVEGDAHDTTCRTTHSRRPQPQGR